MSEKRKSTPKAKVLTAVLLVLFLGSCAVLVFAVCTDILGINNNQPSTNATTVAATTAATDTTANTESTPATTSVATEASEVDTFDIILSSTYDVDYWVEYKDEYGSAGIGVLFGAHAQGATLNFEDGQFVVTVKGANEILDVASGTYSFVSETEIELRYDNSDIKTAEVVETEGGVVTVLDFSMDIEGTTLRASIAD